MDNTRINSRYKYVVKHNYKKVTIKVKIVEELEILKLPVKLGVRQGVFISPTLFKLVLKDVFKQLNWESKGLNIDDRYRSHL